MPALVLDSELQTPWRGRMAIAHFREQNDYFAWRSQLLQNLHAELTGVGVAALSQIEV